MGTEVVVVGADEGGSGDSGGGGDVAAALAAGGAAVEAEYAAADAAEALATADAAMATADLALSEAWSAPSREEVEGLYSRIAALEDERDAAVSKPGPASEEFAMSPPRVTETPEPAAASDAGDEPKEQPAKKKFGNDSWFGRR